MKESVWYEKESEYFVVSICNEKHSRDMSIAIKAPTNTIALPSIPLIQNTVNIVTKVAIFETEGFHKPIMGIAIAV